MSTNGRLDLSTLVPVDGWAFLTRNTAAAWEAGCDEIVALSYPRPTITAPDGAYRPYAQQVAMKAYWAAQGKPENAATPGTSGHGWATDVDIFKVWLWPHDILERVFGKYGFTFNVSWELWHMHHNGTATASLTPTLIEQEEDDEMSAEQVKEILDRIDKQTSTTINMLMEHMDADRKAIIARLDEQTGTAINMLMVHMDGDRQAVLDAVTPKQ